MKSIEWLFLLSVLMTLCFCASTTKVYKPLDPRLFNEETKLNYEVLEIEPGETSAPRHFLQAVYSYLEVELKEMDMMNAAEQNFQVKIEIEGYKMRKGFVKKHLGIFAGKDGVRSSVTVTNKNTGEVVGEALVDTFNIESSTTIDDMAHMHAAKIAKYLTGE